MVLAGGVDAPGQIADALGAGAEPGFWVCFALFGGSEGAPLPLWWLLIWQGDEQFGTLGAVPCKQKQGIPGCRRGLCGRREQTWCVFAVNVLGGMIKCF